MQFGIEELGEEGGIREKIQSNVKSGVMILITPASLGLQSKVKAQRDNYSEDGMIALA